MVGLLFLATAISYIDRQTLAVVAPMLRNELGISNFGYARILSSFLMAYTVMQAVTGWMIDSRRHPPRLRPHHPVVVCRRYAPCLRSRSDLFLSVSFPFGRRRGGKLGRLRAGGLGMATQAGEGFGERNLGAGTSAGMVLSVPLVAWITLWLGWRAAFVITGLLGLVWLFSWLAFFPAAGGASSPHTRGARSDSRGRAGRASRVAVA